MFGATLPPFLGVNLQIPLASVACRKESLGITLPRNITCTPTVKSRGGYCNRQRRSPVLIYILRNASKQLPEGKNGKDCYSVEYKHFILVIKKTGKRELSMLTIQLELPGFRNACMWLNRVLIYFLPASSFLPGLICSLAVLLPMGCVPTWSMMVKCDVYS